MLSVTKRHFTVPAAIAPSGNGVATPFLDKLKKGQEEYGNRTGDAVKQKSNWQRLAMILGCCVVALTGAVVYLAGKVTVKVYVVEVAEAGQVRSVGILPHEFTHTDKKPIKFVVNEWLEWMRFIGTDEVALGKQWEKAQAFMTQSSTLRAKEFFHVQKMRFKRGETTQIKYHFMEPVAGYSKSYVVEWNEKTYSQQGILLSDEDWKATLRIDIIAPKTLNENDLQELRNPLGIFISDVQWGVRAEKKRS